MTLLQRLGRRPFFIRLLHWEYWSFNQVYGWVLPIWALLALRARSFFFFAAANPTIENGGFLMESKKKIYDLMPPSFYPATLFFRAGTPLPALLSQMEQQQFTYPVIAKPDVGGQGRGVKKINHDADLAAYAEQSLVDWLLQVYVDYPLEIGVFYYRLPGEDCGRVSGIVGKELLAVTGDGESDLLTLLQADPRHILQVEALKRDLGEGLYDVPAAGERRELVPYGNHARGAKFLDYSHLADDEFVRSIDTICRQVPGFYFGRLDIRYQSWEDLKAGNNFSIIELNGAGSEPTHMYDPRHGLFFAWKEIVRHWLLLFRISRLNHDNGVPYLSHRDGMALMKANKDFERKMKEQYG